MRKPLELLGRSEAQRGPGLPRSWSWEVAAGFSDLAPSLALSDPNSVRCFQDKVCAKLLSDVSLFVTLWTIAFQVPLHGILQARILEWVAISSSRRSSWPRDWTCIVEIRISNFLMGVPGDFPHGGIHPFIQTMFVTAFYGTGPAKLPINGAKVLIFQILLGGGWSGCHGDPSAVTEHPGWAHCLPSAFLSPLEGLSMFPSLHQLSKIPESHPLYSVFLSWLEGKDHQSGKWRTASECPTWSHYLPFLTTGIWTLSCPLYCPPLIWGFPHGSSGKESVCNAGDPGLIPALEMSPGEGTSNPL